MTGIKWQFGGLGGGYGKFLICPKWGKIVVFWTQNQYFKNFFMNLVIRFFWKYTWRQALKSRKKWCFGFWRKVYVLFNIELTSEVLEPGVRFYILLAGQARPLPTWKDLEISKKLPKAARWESGAQHFSLIRWEQRKFTILAEARGCWDLLVGPVHPLPAMTYYCHLNKDRK